MFNAKAFVNLETTTILDNKIVLMGIIYDGALLQALMQLNMTLFLKNMKR